MDDKDVEVQFKAVTGDLLRGVKEAADGIKQATTGMTGDIGSLADTIATMGSSAVVLAGVGLAFEGLRRTMASAIEDTNDLAESFDRLSYETGMSLQDLSRFNAALALIGEPFEKLESWVMGSSRSIKANGDAIAEWMGLPNKAAVQAMPFEEYLRRVMEVSENINEPLKRNEFLMATLGRTGAAEGEALQEFVGALKDVDAQAGDLAVTMDQETIEAMKRTKRATGELTLALQGLKQDLALGGNDPFAEWKQFEADFVNALRTDIDLIKQYSPIIQAWTRTGELFKVIGGGSEAAPKPSLAESQGYETTKPHVKSLEEIQAEKEAEAKALKDKERRAKEAADEQKDLLNAQVQVELSLAKDLEEEKRNFQRQAQKDREQDLKEWNTLLKAQVQVELNAAKDLEEEKLNLEQKAQKEREQNLREWNARQKAQLQAQEADYRRFFGSISYGFTSSVRQMLTEGQTFGQFLKGTFDSVGSAVLQSVESMAAEWLTNLLVTKAMAKTTAASQISGNAGIAATAAMGSVAAIPFYGWSMAPEVGAETFALAMGYMGTIASAAQGYDIPAGVNPLTQLHEREMVLPEKEANTIRNLEGKGGGDTYVFNGVTDRSWWDHNKSNIARTMQEMRGDRRTS